MFCANLSADIQLEYLLSLSMSGGIANSVSFAISSLSNAETLKLLNILKNSTSKNVPHKSKYNKNCSLLPTEP